MKTIKELEELIKNNDLKKYEDMAESYIEKLSKDDMKVTYKMLAAALLAPNAKEQAVKPNIRFSAKKDVTYQRFFITMGKKDKIGQIDVVEFIKSKVEGVSLSDFADVYLLDTYSFFEVDSLKKDIILEKVNNSQYNGREIHLEFSEMRKATNKPSKSYVKQGDKKFYKSSRNDD